MRPVPLISVLAVVVLSGLGLRLIEADEKSLWLDELHTLEIAAADDPTGVVDLLRPDFHAPLHFLTVHALGNLDPHRMRLVSAAIGLLALIPLLALARDGGIGGAGRVALVAGFLLLPYQLRYGVELRPYAWLQLFAATAAWAALSTRSKPMTRCIVFALATALGLYTHYSMAVAVVGIGAARLFIHGRGTLPVWKVVAAGTVGVAAFLPWIFEVESWVFEDPGVMTRDERVTDANGETAQKPVIPLSELGPDLAATPLRMAVPSFGQLGDIPGKVVMGGAGLLALTLLFAFVVSLKSSTSGVAANRTYFGGVFAAVFSMVIMGTACWRIWERVPIQYFALAAWGWPLLIGGLVHGASRRGKGDLVLMATVAALLLMGAGHAYGKSREDLRAGVAKIRELLDAGPAVTTSILRQPDWYHHRSIYLAYARDLTTVEPTDVPPPGDDVPSKVLVVTRNASPNQPGSPPEVWAAVSKGRKLVETIVVDRATVVFVYDVR